MTSIKSILTYLKFIILLNMEKELNQFVDDFELYFTIQKNRTLEAKWRLLQNIQEWVNSVQVKLILRIFIKTSLPDGLFEKASRGM